MLKLIAGTQGNDRSITFQVSTAYRESLQPLSSICYGSEPFRPVEHLAVRRRWNIPTNKSSNSVGESSIQLFWSSSVCNSCLNPGFVFFNSFQSDLLFDLYYLGLKFPDLFRSELFRSFMLCYHNQFDSIFLDLVFSYLIHHSLFVLAIYREPRPCCVQGVVPPPELSEQ